MDTATASPDTSKILNEFSLAVAKRKAPIPFTRENAGEMARKAVIAREEKRRREKEAREQERQDAQIGRDILLGKIRLPDQSPGGQAADEFSKLRLVRVREQLNRLDAMIATERDPQELQRLTAAQAKVSEQEFALAGRPMPGSRRPGRELVAKPSASIAPIEPSS